MPCTEQKESFNIFNASRVPADAMTHRPDNVGDGRHLAVDAI